jgi:hypothetical protein
METGGGRTRMRRPIVVAAATVALVAFGILLAVELFGRDVFTRSDLSAFPWLQYNNRCDPSAPAAKAEQQPLAADRRMVVLADGCIKLWPKPAVERARMGKAYPHTLKFHCSVDPAEFDGSFWYFKEIEIDKGTTPPGIRSDWGTMTLTGPNTAEFRTEDADSPVLRFTRHRGPVVAAVCG